MTSQYGKQTIAMHIFPNISKGKDNQTMKSGHSTEYNIRNIFFEKSYTKNGGETIPRPFSKKLKIEHIPGSTAKSSTKFVFTACQVEGYRNILKISYTRLAFISYKAFLKDKKRSGTSLVASFFA